MSRHLALVCMLSTSIVLAGLTDASAQSSPTTATHTAAVVISKLIAPVYPTIARTAHVAGDVELMLEVRQDGSIESAAVTSGSPLLQRAALTSAYLSQFECIA